MSIRSLLETPVFGGALAVALVGYFIASRILQDALYRSTEIARPTTDLFAIFRGYSQPEPLEMPFYLASFVVVPVVAAFLTWLWQEHRRIVWWLAGIVGFGAAAVGAALAPRIVRFTAAAFQYATSREVVHVLWFVSTKRIVVIAIALTIAALAALAILITRRAPFRERLIAPDANPRFSWFDVAVFAAVLLIVFHPNFPLDPHHYNYFLGPTNDQLHGKPMLYETTHLYGLLDIYALAFIFRYILPLHYPAAAMLTVFFFAAFFVGAYWFLRRWLGSRRLAAAGVGALIAILYLFQTSPTRSALFFPNMSPFRYGWYLPVLFLVSWFGRRRSPWMREAAIFVATLSVFWTFDFGVYLAAATFLALWWVEARTAAHPWRQLVVLAGKFLLYGLGIFAVITALNAFVYGKLPSWYLAVRDAGHFGAGISMAPLPFIGIFEVYLFGYLLVGFVLWYRYRAGQPVDLPLLFLVLYGVFSLLYYVGESSWQIVYAVAGPFVFVLLYLFRHRDGILPSPWLRSLCMGLAYGLLTFALVLALFKLPVEFSGRNYRALASSFRGFGAGELSLADEYDDAQRLKAMFPESARLPIISHFDTPVLVYAGKVNSFDTHYLFGNVLFKPQMQAFIEQVEREKPPVLLVGRRRDDQIEMFLEGIGDRYERVAELRTLDIYRRRATMQ